MKPENEAERLVALRRYQILDTPPDGAFDHIAAMAANFFRVPIAIVSLVDEDRIWFKSHHGVEANQVGRDPGLCASAILSPEVYHLRDALHDVRAMTNPLVAGSLGLRFYAAAPLRTHDGFNLGTLCVIDRNPRDLASDEAEMLTKMAGLVMDQMELRLAAGKIAELQKSERTISEQLRQANGQLVQSEERFRDLFDEAPIAYLYEEIDSRWIKANRAALRILGVKPEEVSETFGASLVANAPETRSRLRDALQSAARGIEARGVVLELRRKDDGKPVWIEWWSKPAAGGRYLRTMFIDITDRVLLEQENERLAKSEREYRTILDAIPQLITALAPNGQYVYANQAVLDYTGLTREDMKAADFRARVFHPEDIERVREERQRGLSAGIPFQNEQRARRKDGQYRWFVIHYRPIRDQYGRVVRWYATGTDIDDQKQAELRLQAENAYLLDEIRTEQNFGDMVGGSSGLRKVMQQVQLVAPTDATVLITGESGTGKELIARAIHERGARSERPLVKLNCSAVPEGLFESEFFGHVKGAFTGALKDKPGRFELADGGTLFLDEIGEVPIAMQAKLLRVLQEQELERLGDTRTRKVNVRVVAASNRDLKKEVDEGRFREDLFYRLSVFPIEVPPLRERREDIAPLVAHFARQNARRMNRPEPQISKSALDQLAIYRWPGNVRELQNTVERALILWRDGPLTFDLPASPQENTAQQTKPEVKVTLPTRDELKRQEREGIINALKRTNGKVSGPGGAAELLGMKPSTLSSRMSSLSINRRTLS